MLWSNKWKAEYEPLQIERTVMSKFYLVACVGEKLPLASAAKDLYVSDWFKKARAYVEGQLKDQDSWYILSAKYFLVSPDRQIEPYELTLNKMTRMERLAWADNVWAQLREILCPQDTVEFLAGRRYREFLVERVEGICVAAVPMSNLAIGMQKKWLKERIEEADRLSRS